MASLADTFCGFRCTEVLTQFDRLQGQSSRSQAQTRKRKRTPDTGDPPAQSTAVSRPKHLQTCPSRAAVDFTSGKAQSRGAGKGKSNNHIDYWRKERRWPKEYFEGQSSMSHLLARKKSSYSLRRRQSEAGSVTSSDTPPSDQQPREVKSAPYKDQRYETLSGDPGQLHGQT